MKALLYKDMISIWKYNKTTLAASAVFLAMSVISDEQKFLMGFPVIILGMLTNALLAYDERDKWDRLSLTLPVSRRLIVSEKYVLGLLLQAAVFSVAVVANLVAMAAKGDKSYEGMWTTVVTLELFALTGMSFILPATFRWGSEKGRTVYMILAGMIGAVGAVLLNLVQSAYFLPGGLLPWLLGLVAIVLAVIYPVSWLVAVRWYEKREF